MNMGNQRILPLHAKRKQAFNDRSQKRDGIGFFIFTILILHFIFLIWIDLDNGDLLKGVNNGV